MAALSKALLVDPGQEIAPAAVALKMHREGMTHESEQDGAAHI